MGARRIEADARPDEEAIRERFEEQGLEPRTWSSGAGHRFAGHAHARHKVLYCIKGSIDFEIGDGILSLAPGDRLEIPSGTEHAATVGPNGVDCMEAFS